MAQGQGRLKLLKLFKKDPTVKWGFLLRIKVERYLDLDGDSGVAAYEIGETYIRVKSDRTFKIYTYSYESAGIERIEIMKKLSRSGDGLNSYIKLNANKLYEQ